MTSTPTHHRSVLALGLRPSPTTIAATLLLGAMALPLPAWAQQYITSDRTVAGGNPLDGNYNGQFVIVGASNIFNGVVTRVADVDVDIIEPARFGYSDQTGGGVRAYSNSRLHIAGGTFDQITSNGFGGGVVLYDTASAAISGGNLRGLGLYGETAGGAGSVSASFSGGLVENGLGGVAVVQNGVLNVSGGTVRASGGNSAIAAGAGSVVNLSGGLVQSVSGAAVYINSDSAFTMTGGTASAGPGAGPQWGVLIESTTNTATLQGGTVNGGLRANALDSVLSPQATLGGGLTVNGGVFAYGNAALNVTGGSYTRFAGIDAEFFALGNNSINFYGTDLALSGPTPGQIFEPNGYTGNFYTFTSGTFSDGQSAVGLRLFDAVTVAGSPVGGGYTLNTSPVPEPAAWLLMLMALPAVGAAARRCRAA